MKKIMLICAAMVAMVACNNRNVANDKDDTVTSSQVEKTPSEELIMDSIDPMGKDPVDTTLLPMTFDFMDREAYLDLIKSAVRYDRDHDSITLDSAIEYYNDVPKDSIEKWWKQR